MTDYRNLSSSFCIGLRLSSSTFGARAGISGLSFVVEDRGGAVRKLTAFWSERAANLARFTAGKTALDQMVTLAEHLPELASPDAEADKRHTRLRNAAWTLVDRTAGRICTAGRFALRGDRDERKRFRRVEEKRSKRAKKE